MTKLNCKPGDLAVIVRTKTHPAHIGGIVRCVKLVPWDDGRPTWEIENPVNNFIFILDSCLRPLRDSEGIDEILKIVGLPKKETA